MRMLIIHFFPYMISVAYVFIPVRMMLPNVRKSTRLQTERKKSSKISASFLPSLTWIITIQVMHNRSNTLFDGIVALDS